MLKWMKRAMAFLFALLFLIAGTDFASAQAGGQLDQSKLEEIEAYVREQYRIGGFPGGAYAIVFGDEIVAAEGIGYSDKQEGRDATADTIYSVASITKVMTATAILKLAEQGALDLDRSVADYLPWFQYRDKERSDKVTIRHLLTRSAGVSRYSADGAIYNDIDNNRNSMENAARELRTVKMNADPGVKGQYCNTCYNVLGLVIEKVTNQPYAAYMEQEIFRPLGMDHTVYDPTRLIDADIAAEYGYLFGLSVVVSPYWETFGASQQPEGGAYSSVTDLARFAAAALRSESLQLHAQAGITASDLKGSVYTESGFEARELHGTGILYKSGEGMGASSNMVLIPDKNVGLVLLIGESNGERLSVLSEGLTSLLLDKEPTSVKGVINVFRVLGYISMAIVFISFIMFVRLTISALRLRRDAGRLIRRWGVFTRLSLFAPMAAGLWYLLLEVRLTEAGFYGYPYDIAIALFCLVVALSAWVVYSLIVIRVSYARSRNAGGSVVSQGVIS